MTVEKNIACGYRGDKKHLKAKVADYIERYQLNGLENSIRDSFPEVASVSHWHE